MVPDPVTLCVTHTCGAPNFFQLEDTYACTIHAPGTGRGHHERSESRRRAAARSGEGAGRGEGTGRGEVREAGGHGHGARQHQHRDAGAARVAPGPRSEGGGANPRAPPDESRLQAEQVTAARQCRTGTPSGWTPTTASGASIGR